jgi:uncharacterized protein YkwD
MPPANLRRIAVAVLASLTVLVSSAVGANQASAAPGLTVAQLQSTLANAMFSLLNSERKANHLAPVGGSPTLVKSAAAHNLVMAKHDSMSHQCSGEASPGTRIRSAGYTWHSWGENIGWSSTETVTGIQNMEKEMYIERPPDNGHRLNILGKFKAVGIAVYLDPVHHIFWYTQDFAS